MRTSFPLWDRPKLSIRCIGFNRLCGSCSRAECIPRFRRSRLSDLELTVREPRWTHRSLIVVAFLSSSNRTVDHWSSWSAEKGRSGERHHTSAKRRRDLAAPYTLDKQTAFPDLLVSQCFLISSSNPFILRPANLCSILS
jgi:hypothetical protein